MTGKQWKALSEHERDHLSFVMRMYGDMHEAKDICVLPMISSEKVIAALRSHLGFHSPRSNYGTRLSHLILLKLS